MRLLCAYARTVGTAVQILRNSIQYLFIRAHPRATNSEKGDMMVCLHNIRIQAFHALEDVRSPQVVPENGKNERNKSRPLFSSPLRPIKHRTRACS